MNKFPTIYQEIKVNFDYPVIFTYDIFNEKNSIFLDTIKRKENNRKHKLLFVIDENIAKLHSNIIKKIENYVKINKESLESPISPLIVKGGEKIKEDYTIIEKIQEYINIYGLCRHSFVVAIGGGAVLDMVGFATALPHRGIRIIRIPTTVLAQNDAGVGVKNGINKFNKKNFLGTFFPPFAVINDYKFLETLSTRDCLAGIIEGVKVALLKDKDFFYFIKENSEKICKRDMEIIKEVIYKSAYFHLKHIRESGDPFEMGSARPLDFGHWIAHKLESLSNYKVRHGEAVAVGIALDSYYSYHIGLLNKKELDDIIECLKKLKMNLYYPEMENKKEILKGLDDFREHLGGILCITLLKNIGSKVEVNQMDTNIIEKGLEFLKEINKRK